MTVRDALRPGFRRQNIVAIEIQRDRLAVACDDDAVMARFAEKLPCLTIILRALSSAPRNAVEAKALQARTKTNLRMLRYCRNFDLRTIREPSGGLSRKYAIDGARAFGRLATRIF
jgi:hypothetical protein